MAVTLDELKLYLRIDDDAEDIFLNRCLSSALSYVTDAVSDYDTTYAASPRFADLADMVILGIAREYYERRDTDAKGIPEMIQRSILKLQYWVVDSA